MQDTELQVAVWYVHWCMIVYECSTETTNV